MTEVLERRVLRSASSGKGKQDFTLHLREHQLEVYENLRRFNVLLAHRRFGKTVLAIVVLLTKALECKHTRPQLAYYCPTYSQAKRVAWNYVHELAGPIKGVKFNEAELKCTLPNGAMIQLGSADNPDASRGIYLDYVVLDEPAQMPPKMWTEVLRPALSDRKGGALFIGTPQGRHGLFYDSYTEAATNPEWWRGIFKASETGIVDADELQSAQRAMSPAEYAQEYECSFDAAVKGAYWADAMAKADADGRIKEQLAHRAGHQVHIALDLGINDATACWFFQTDGEMVRFIAYAEYTNMGLPDIVADWKARPYTYGKVIVPHDAQNRSLSTGQTRQQTLYQLGVDTVVAPKVPVIDGIEAVRLFLNRCSWDATACRQGVEALRQYRADWQDKNGVLKLQPLHDWTSHGADAMRYLAVTGLDAVANSWAQLDYSNMDAARCA